MEIQLYESEFLPPVNPPYLPPSTSNKLTLVLDLDETLVHYLESESRILVRPGTSHFLEILSNYYELVIFTAGLQDYADWAIDFIDANRYISHRLYRQHTILLETGNIKDLSKIGRDIKKVIIIDNLRENFKLQQENGIWIKTWYDDFKDTALIELCQLLKGLFINHFRCGIKQT